ncbi:interferon regulatory factor 1-like isoform X2 [Physella acuta]|uniref:interferon regulatory factor 1-like isoform X2 n=1 Tax=Physella acuta TaxID=109671 RepID=UPI0027DC0F2A|nr:interferon regulatory factor 1-like isoform X2 [Physella acuta]
MTRRAMKERVSRRCRKAVVMPPTLRYRSSSNSNSRVRNRPGARMRMRAWLEKLLNDESCRGLEWKNREKKEFTIVWRHASSHGFVESEHGDVFLKWAQHTGKINQQSPGNHSSNKSNFRCALHSLKDCIELTGKGDKKGEQAKRTFRFIDPGHPEYNKKRKAGKRSQKSYATGDDHDTKPSYLHEINDSESGCSSTDSLPSTSTAQALFSGKSLNLHHSDIHYPDTSSLQAPVSFSQATTAALTGFTFTPSTHSATSRNTVPKLDMLLAPSSGSHQAENPSVSQSNLGGSPVTITTETSPDGITTIILQATNSFTNSTSTSQLDSVTQRDIKMELSPSLTTQQGTSDTYKSLYNPLNTRLNCGGQVKIKETKPETLQLPEYQIPTNTITTSLAPVHAEEFEIAYTMEIESQDDNNASMTLNQENNYSHMGQAPDLINYDDNPNGNNVEVYSSNMENYQGVGMEQSDFAQLDFLHQDIFSLESC